MNPYVHYMRNGRMKTLDGTKRKERKVKPYVNYMKNGRMEILNGQTKGEKDEALIRQLYEKWKNEDTGRYKKKGGKGEALYKYIYMINGRMKTLNGTRDGRMKTLNGTREGREM